MSAICVAAVVAAAAIADLNIHTLSPFVYIYLAMPMSKPKYVTNCTYDWLEKS